MYLRAKFHVRGFNDSRVIAIKPKAEESVRATTVSLYILQILPRHYAYIYPAAITISNFRTRQSAASALKVRASAMSFQRKELMLFTQEMQLTCTV
jgi:hypothetical protein